AAVQAHLAAYVREVRADLETCDDAAQDELRREVRALQQQLGAVGGGDATLAAMKAELATLRGDLRGSAAAPPERRRSTLANLRHELADLRAHISAGGRAEANPDVVGTLKEQLARYAAELRLELPQSDGAAQRELRDELRELQNEISELRQQETQRSPRSGAASVSDPLSEVSEQLAKLREDVRLAAAPKPQPERRRVTFRTMQADLADLQAQSTRGGRQAVEPSAEIVSNLREQLAEYAAELRTELPLVGDAEKGELRAEVLALQKQLAAILESAPKSKGSSSALSVLGEHLGDLREDLRNADAQPEPQKRRAAFRSMLQDVEDLKARAAHGSPADANPEIIETLKEQFATYGDAVRTELVGRTDAAAQGELRDEMRKLQLAFDEVESRSLDSIKTELEGLRGHLRRAATAPHPERRRATFATMTQDLADLKARMGPGRPAEASPEILSALKEQFANYVNELKTAMPESDGAARAEVREEVRTLQQQLGEVRGSSLEAMNARLDQFRNELRAAGAAPAKALPEGDVKSSSPRPPRVAAAVPESEPRNGTVREQELEDELRLLKVQLADLQGRQRIAAVPAPAPAPTPEKRRETFAHLKQELAGLKPGRSAAHPETVQAVKEELASYMKEIKAALPQVNLDSHNELKAEIRALQQQLLEVQRQVSPRRSDDGADDGPPTLLSTMNAQLNAMKEEIKASAAPARRRTTYANLKRDMEELQ
ncbi:hypothetical protein M885DRAFT_64083, partial [Pelagophyceae sp. CCMP2097]